MRLVGEQRDEERLARQHSLSRAEELAHQAFHDPLTDLPNRDLFKDRVGHALARQVREVLGGELH